MISNRKFSKKSLWQTRNLRTIITLLMLMATAALLSPAFADDLDSCVPCHGNIAEIHATYSHNTLSQTGAVTIFPDNGHDDAGHIGAPPYFAVPVNCDTCHARDLIAIHAENCETCHPTPYDTLGDAWQGGCQQGGCHQGYHSDSSVAHNQWEDPYDPENDCLQCHNSYTDFTVPQTNCLNCHSSYDAGDAIPPETTTSIQDGATYIGPAKIKFHMTDNGKVGLGATFYRVDNLSFSNYLGGEVFVSEPGSHELEFYSVDQAGNQESPTKYVSFEVQADNEPPTTATNALDGGVYYNGAAFTLNATDNGTLGVKNTFYTIDGGPTQTGTFITFPNTFGTFAYTINYWSEDWTGNVEAVNSATVTVKSGPGTIRLVWWDSDTNPAHAPDADYNEMASWEVRRGGFGYSYPLVASGSGDAATGWDGIDDILVPVSPTGYYVRIDWESDGYSDQTDFANIVVDTPGEVITLHY